jgi:hypothetical protein
LTRSAVSCKQCVAKISATVKVVELLLAAAGAGTGKTSTLITRILYLLAQVTAAMTKTAAASSHWLQHAGSLIKLLWQL